MWVRGIDYLVPVMAPAAFLNNGCLSRKVAKVCSDVMTCLAEEFLSLTMIFPSAV